MAKFISDIINWSCSWCSYSLNRHC